MGLEACMSSKRMDWCTPRSLFDRYDAVHRFDLDAAATQSNALCDRYLGPPGEVASTLPESPECVGVDALAIRDWPGQRIWLNPPYGRGLGRWYARAVAQTLIGSVVVMLVPARTDTTYWHEWVIDEHSEPRPWVRCIDYIRGRIKFVGAADGAPFPSAVITFGPAQEDS